VAGNYQYYPWRVPKSASASQSASPRARRSDAVYHQLRRQIILAHLQGGTALTELEIASTMACSQGTVREAMLRLQEEGLVLRQSYQGSVVTPVSSLEAHAFLELRAQLESQALAHSLPSMTAQDLDELAQRVRLMERLASKGDEYGLFEADQAFHVALFQMARLPALVPVLIRCSLYNHRNKISQRHASRTLAQTASRHWEIVEALRMGQVPEAQRVLRHHVQSVSGHEESGPSLRAPVSAPSMSAMQRDIFDRVAREDAGLPDITTLPRAQALAQFEMTRKRWNRIDEERFTLASQEIPAPSGRKGPPRSLSLLSVRSRHDHDPRRGVIVYLHGGGWTFGSNATHLGALAQLNRRTGCEVIGVDYGLAPDHPFPEGLNDCVWAWRWLRAHRSPQGPWFLAGDSSGANLALAAMLDLRHAGDPLPDAGLLFYGVYDAALESTSHDELGTGAFGLSTQRMRWYRSQYLSGRLRDPNDPRVSPLRADLSGLPPLFLNAAGLDPLRDDTLNLAAKLAAAGTLFQLHRCEGVVHGFMQMSSELDAAALAFDEAAAFIRSRQPAG
jgi:acetyl esterase/lipase/DNA-binding GntR family transcriptional regulator